MSPAGISLPDTSFSGAVDDDVEYDRGFCDAASVTVYDESGKAYTLYEGADGHWREGDGTTYVRLSDPESQVKDGNKHLFAH